MDEQDYQKLLAYLKNPSKVGKEYEKYVSQFEERYNYIYREEWRMISRRKVEWIMSIFHDDPMKAHQNANTMY